MISGTNETCDSAVLRILNDLISINRVAAQSDTILAVHQALTAGDLIYPVGTPLPVPSQVRDGIEFSLALSSKGSDGLRYGVDVLEGKHNLKANVQVAQYRGHQALDILGYEHHHPVINKLFQTLFPNLDDLPPRKFATWFAVGYKEGAPPTLKVYFNLEIDGQLPAMTKAYNVLIMCGLEQEFQKLCDVAKLVGRDVSLIGVDLGPTPDLRVKVYLRPSRMMNKQIMQQLLAIHGQAGETEAFELFNQCVLGNLQTYPNKSTQINLGFAPHTASPSIRMDVRSRRFFSKEIDLSNNLKKLLANMQLNCQYYEDTLQAVSQGDATAHAWRFHTIVGIALRDGWYKINIYLAPNFLGC